MIKSQYLYIGLLVLLNIFLLVRVYLNSHKDVLNSNWQSTDSFERKILEDDYIAVSKFSNERISKDVFCHDEENNIFMLEDLLTGGKKLVLRYPAYGCQVCLDSALSDLIQLANQVGKDNVLILTDFMDARNLMIFKRVNELKSIAVYNLKSNLGLTLENLKKPFFFIANENLSCKMFFIHEILFPDLTKRFLMEVMNDFYKTDI